MGGPGSGRKKGSGKNTFARKSEPRVVKQTKYATTKKQILVKSKKAQPAMAGLFYWKNLKLFAMKDYLMKKGRRSIKHLEMV